MKVKACSWWYMIWLVQILSITTGIHCKDETRDRSHIENLLHLDSSLSQYAASEARLKNCLNNLTNIYRTAIQPVEAAYKFADLGHPPLTENDIRAPPMVLFAGPWSTGKSTMVNYLVGIDEDVHKLRTGAEPTTSEFTVVMGGSQFRTVAGLVMAADKSRGFTQLESFGQGFLEKLEGLEMPYPILDKVVFVDTPGIIENRKQQERGYPFNAVMKWFINRAELIFIVFDPTKLDVGSELESLFKQLKGRESQIRLILNKGDSISMQELMRVYGALFWSMSPLINVTEPPRIYIGSFWQKPFKNGTNDKLFLMEEKSLLHDLNEVIQNQIENKIALVRQHATNVRIHALLVDRYVKAFSMHSSIFTDQEELLAKIVDDPEKYNIPQSVISQNKVSKYDLPGATTYREFFSIHALNMFQRNNQHCPWFSMCIMDRLGMAIQDELPQLLLSYKEIQENKCPEDGCPSQNPEP